ncbi:hypothetical protein [Leeia aquatica]|uniref:Uncharacterized protein n=1 Tax=Leeia aquatica TaxID=2725557 RepID=A0A847S7G2_9NEIS|nr:hypothetical protein [Leeia aquatica]NLR73576.1 hypothetical protein [Leeia aquatica]
MSTKSYRVRGIDLDVDEKRIPEGSEIELGDESASKLARWLEPVVKPEPAKSGKYAKSNANKQADSDTSKGAEDSGQAEGNKQ